MSEQAEVRKIGIVDVGTLIDVHRLTHCKGTVMEDMVADLVECRILLSKLFVHHRMSNPSCCLLAAVEQYFTERGYIVGQPEKRT